ncbi:MAG: TetR/AcrR family transcriptional regulator [Cytophagaceae bacterium]|jgi:AcrR family transcriptional regulator|nr:TetR/AcrR family transcriptional regulator [Cytophagaceae bacterium]
MNKASTTRLTILHKAFELVYANGYHATSVDDILATTHVTKGAFYYHFKNKDEMGIALIKEVLYPGMREALIKPLLHSSDSTSEIFQMMKALLQENSFFQVKYGCPAINLIEEMGGSHAGFRKALKGLFNEWQQALQKSIEQGKSSGQLRKDVNAQQVALFITTGYGGIRNLGKLFGKECYGIYLKELNVYLKGLIIIK